MLSNRLQILRDFTQQRKFKQYRKSVSYNLRKIFKNSHYAINMRIANLLKVMCDLEDPIVFKDEKIAFIRTNVIVPKVYKNKEICKEYHIPKSEFWNFCNVCINWEILLNEGLQERRKKVVSLISKTNDKKKIEFYNSVLISIDAVLSLAKRYENVARAVGNIDVAESFSNVPANKPRNLKEALQAIRFVHAMFYMIGQEHMGFGRLDQYLYQFYEQDIKNNIPKEELKELLAEFFISLNKDSDLYPGVQQGDNGQSVMLGGCKPEDGSSAINDLTYLVLDVSKDLKLIDPKINLRIDSNTPLELLELASELTECGLGFPQYSNDDVVIPALVKKGYALEDARNYTVAACWEFIIPGKGADIVNIGALSFPAAVDKAFEEAMLLNGYFFSMNLFRQLITKNINNQVKALSQKRLMLAPSPITSIFYDDVLEKGNDASICAKYRNIGIHGAGSANAADALAAIKWMYEKNGVKGLRELLKAKRQDFKGYESLRTGIIDNIPKVGNADDFVDSELTYLFNEFAKSAKKYSRNGKVIRPGSGSAMFYIWLADENAKFVKEPKVKATADGKLNGEPLSTSLAPSHNVKVKGILSVLKSYSKINYSEIMNGGPITIELSPSVFNSDNGVHKLAQLIQYFVKLGNQQLQLNVLDSRELEDAIKHPEKHRNLIVRVWGWSGYFTELAPEYQQHVLKRHKYEL